MFVELPFGALYFDRRSFFRTWLLLNAGLGMTLTLIDIAPRTILVSHTEKFLLWVVLTSALARFLGFNSRISTLRGRLKQKVKELEELSTRFAELATHDDLTGLINRREFNRRCVIESSRSLRSGIPHSLAVLDVDHFKTINDRYGHATGDLVLK